MQVAPDNRCAPHFNRFIAFVHTACMPRGFRNALASRQVVGKKACLFASPEAKGHTRSLAPSRSREAEARPRADDAPGWSGSRRRELRAGPTVPAAPPVQGGREGDGAARGTGKETGRAGDEPGDGPHRIGPDRAVSGGKRTAAPGRIEPCWAGDGPDRRRARETGPDRAGPGPAGLGASQRRGRGRIGSHRARWATFRRRFSGASGKPQAAHSAGAPLSQKTAHQGGFLPIRGRENDAGRGKPRPISGRGRRRSKEPVPPPTGRKLGTREP